VSDAVALLYLRRRWPRAVVAAIVVAQLLLLLAPPLLLSDVFTYINYARLDVLHGLNPYTHAPDFVRHDAIYPLAEWHRQPTPYGPLFTLLSYPFVPLGVWGALWGFKVLVVGAALGCLGLVAACARRLGRDPLLSAAVLGLNPLVLVYGVGGVHNDALVMLLVLGAVYLTLTRREAIANVAGVAAGAMKASMLPLLPFFVVAARRRGRALVVAAVSAASLLALAVALFGTRAPGLAQQTHNVNHRSLPNVISDLVGARPSPCLAHPITCHSGSLQLVSHLVLVAILIVMVWRAWRGADWITCAGWTAFALVATLPWLLPWYIVWCLPFAILSRSRRLQVATGVLGLYLLFTSSIVSGLLVSGLAG
jgi:hypothetical protein